nr:MAG TPA: hypothetical protein [Caudoviricetes sp.]
MRKVIVILFTQLYALKSAYFMKKTRTPNVKTLFKQHRHRNLIF